MPRAKKNPKIAALEVKIVSAMMTGLYDKAKELSDQVKALKEEDKAKAKAAKATKAKPKKTASKAPRGSKIVSKPPKTTKTPSRAKKTISEPVEEADETASYIAPSRPKGRGRGNGGEFVGPDGKAHTYSRRESMAGSDFKNQFNAKEYDVRLPANHAKVDSKLRKAKLSPRPGQPGASRPAATKISVRCQGGCNGDYEVYPWECEKVDAKTKYICNDCIH
jgi:hypothetical protein